METYASSGVRKYLKAVNLLGDDGSVLSAYARNDQIIYKGIPYYGGFWDLA